MAYSSMANFYSNLKSSKIISSFAWNRRWDSEMIFCARENGSVLRVLKERKWGGSSTRWPKSY